MVVKWVARCTDFYISSLSHVAQQRHSSTIEVQLHKCFDVGNCIMLRFPLREQLRVQICTHQIRLYEFVANDTIRNPGAARLRPFRSNNVAHNTTTAHSIFLAHAETNAGIDATACNKTGAQAKNTFWGSCWLGNWYWWQKTWRQIFYVRTKPDHIVSEFYYYVKTICLGKVLRFTNPLV